MKRLLLALCEAAIMIGCTDADRSAPDAATATKPTAAVPQDNTAVNARDRAGTSATPIDQKENQSDISVTADIRKRVVDTEMSIDAQNAKIITRDGKVTLRGPVKSADEKERIEQIAGDVVGPQNVVSELEVQP